MGQLLLAFAYASDLAFGLEMEDGARSCLLALRIAERLGASEEELATVYYTSLLKDAGCTSWTADLARLWQADEIIARRELFMFTDRSSRAGIEAWLHRYAPEADASERPDRLGEVLSGLGSAIEESARNTAEVATRIATRLGMPASVCNATLHLFEQWDGSGLLDGLRGEEIPLASRIILPAFVFIPVMRLHGPGEALSAIERHSGQHFDPSVCHAIEELSGDEGFFAALFDGDVASQVIALEPQMLPEVGEPEIDSLALAFSDFVDLKSPYTAAHSRRVAKVAEQLSILMACAPQAVAGIRRAALLHDLGLVGISSFTLGKPALEMTMTEREAYALHPYYGERVLRRAAPLAPLAEMVGTHQERLDGSGYFRGLKGPAVSLGARIIAIADSLDELTHDAPGREAIDVEQAIAFLERDKGLDGEIVRKLGAVLGLKGETPPQKWPSGLTGREVEVLRLGAKGLSRPQIGEALGITENTVRNHLDHIYTKTETSTRVGATLFAIENGLIV